MVDSRDVICFVTFMMSLIELIATGITRSLGFFRKDLRKTHFVRAKLVPTSVKEGEGRRNEHAAR